MRLKTFLCIGTALVIAGCGDDLDSQDKNGDVARGRALFMRNGCAVCHGKAGRGDGQVAASLKPPPRDFRDSLAYKNGNGPEEIARSIARGVPGSSMPGYGHLSADDLRLVAVYIRSLQSVAIGEKTKE